jgi:hypothetical protein
MALYCMTCSTPAGHASAVCDVCRNGFTSRLGCSTCGKVVPAGYSYCPHCTPSYKVESSALARPVCPHSSLPAVTGGFLPSFPALPGLDPRDVVVPEVRNNVGKFGVDASVQMSGHDADIMTEMNQVAILLHALAQRMNTFQGIGDSTRAVIRGCRDLATRLQEEVEIRKGPS